MSRLNPAAWYRKPAAGIPATDLAAAAARPLGVVGPADVGYSGWTIDPLVATTTVAVASGNLVFGRVKLATSGPISSVAVVVTTGGSSLTSSWVAVWALDGTLLGVSADQTTSWQSTGTKTVSLATPTASQSVGATVVAGALAVGTTGPTLRAGTAAASVNLGTTAATALRFGLLTAQASIPSPLPLASTASLTNTVLLAVA
jgi:hypothetical protein